MQNKIILGILVCLLFTTLVILFCIVIVKLYIKKIKEHNLKELEFQKTLNKSIIETQEQLLATISNDLHDDVGQQLTVINFQLEHLKLQHPDCENHLQPVSDSVGKVSHSLREISHSLNANWLDRNGLIHAITSEIERIQKNKSIAAELTIDSHSLVIKNDVQIVIFRIFQESINNVLKHSKATKIEINIVTQPFFEITIKDNGCGFDPKIAWEKPNSIGIHNCINRAKLIEYDFEITSVLNQGTTLILREKTNHHE